MADNQLYTFDRQSMRRISAAVQKSEGVKDRKGNKWYPVKGGGGATLKIGKTTAEWTKASTQEITPTDTAGNATGDPVTVLNLFADVGGPGKWCAFMKSGQTYILIAAECDEV